MRLESCHRMDMVTFRDWSKGLLEQSPSEMADDGRTGLTQPISADPVSIASIEPHGPCTLAPSASGQINQCQDDQIGGEPSNPQRYRVSRLRCRLRDTFPRHQQDHQLRLSNPAINHRALIAIFFTSAAAAAAAMAEQILDQVRDLVDGQIVRLRLPAHATHRVAY